MNLTEASRRTNTTVIKGNKGKEMLMGLETRIQGVAQTREFSEGIMSRRFVDLAETSSEKDLGVRDERDVKDEGSKSCR